MTTTRICIACGLTLETTEVDGESPEEVSIITRPVLCDECELRSDEQFFVCEIVATDDGLMRGDRAGWIEKHICPKVRQDVVLIPPQAFDIIEGLMYPEEAAERRLLVELNQET